MGGFFAIYVRRRRDPRRPPGRRRFLLLAGRHPAPRRARVRPDPPRGGRRSTPATARSSSNPCSPARRCSATSETSGRSWAGPARRGSPTSGPPSSWRPSPSRCRWRRSASCSGWPTTTARRSATSPSPPRRSGAGTTRKEAAEWGRRFFEFLAEQLAQRVDATTDDAVDDHRQRGDRRRTRTEAEKLGRRTSSSSRVTTPRCTPSARRSPGLVRAPGARARTARGTRARAASSSRVAAPADLRTCMARTATTDTVIGGQAIAAGDRLMLFFTSANHDERKFPHAETFDLDRDSGSHVTFGVGPHRCQGEHLARLELVIVVEEVLARMPGIPPSPRAPRWSTAAATTGAASRSAGRAASVDDDVVVVGGAAQASPPRPRPDAGASAPSRGLAALGGSTAVASVFFLAAGTGVQRDAGIDDEPEALFRFWMTCRASGSPARRSCAATATRRRRRWRGYQHLGVAVRRGATSAPTPLADRPPSTDPDGGGQAIVDALARACRERYVDVAVASRVDHLVVEDDRVAGVDSGGETCVPPSSSRAPWGSPRTRELLAAHFPDTAIAGDDLWSPAPVTRQGEGLDLAAAAGAATEGHNRGEMVLSNGLVRDSSRTVPAGSCSSTAEAAGSSARRRRTPSCCASSTSRRRPSGRSSTKRPGRAGPSASTTCTRRGAGARTCSPGPWRMARSAVRHTRCARRDD